jgi:hypothetical protein
MRAARRNSSAALLRVLRRRCVRVRAARFVRMRTQPDGGVCCTQLLSALLVLLLMARALRLPTLVPRAHRGAAEDASRAAATRAHAATCVAWRATRCGSLLAERAPLEDLPCYARISPRMKHVSGARRSTLTPHSLAAR